MDEYSLVKMDQAGWREYGVPALLLVVCGRDNARGDPIVHLILKSLLNGLNHSDDPQEVMNVLGTQWAHRLAAR